MQMLPDIVVRTRTRKMEPQLATTLYDARRNLEHAKPECARLRARPVRPVRNLLQNLHQYASGCVQKQPELVGPEPMAARPAARHIQLQLLDPVLPVAPLAVEQIDPLRFPPDRK